MSKKKTKIEKVATRHQFAHLEKNIPKNVVLKSVVNDNASKNIEGPSNGQGPLIIKDLKFTGVLITVFVLLIVTLGIIVHYTPIASDILLKFGIKY